MPKVQEQIVVVLTPERASKFNTSSNFRPKYKRLHKLNVTIPYIYTRDDAIVHVSWAFPNKMVYPDYNPNIASTRMNYLYKLLSNVIYYTST